MQNHFALYIFIFVIICWTHKNFQSRFRIPIQISMFKKSQVHQKSQADGLELHECMIRCACQHKLIATWPCDIRYVMICKKVPIKYKININSLILPLFACYCNHLTLKTWSGHDIGYLTQTMGAWCPVQ